MTEFIENIDLHQIKEITLFVFVITCEERSVYAYNQLRSHVDFSKDNLLCFIIEDYDCEQIEHNVSMINHEEIEIYRLKKEKYKDFIDIIRDRIETLRRKDENVKICFDYSSMPRYFYVKGFLDIYAMLAINDELTCIYAQGDYVTDIDNYATTGADEFILLCGKASINPQSRTHVIGLGYDKNKTEAICSVIDPNRLVSCYAAPNTTNAQMESKIREMHFNTINSSVIKLSFNINDFIYIFRKLHALAFELKFKGDVIFLPDGPKPLILAQSIIPMFSEKVGIMSFFISSHKKHVNNVDVKPTGVFTNFKIKKWECLESIHV